VASKRGARKGKVILVLDWSTGQAAPLGCWRGSSRIKDRAERRGCRKWNRSQKHRDRGYFRRGPGFANPEMRCRSASRKMHHPYAIQRSTGALGDQIRAKGRMDRGYSASLDPRLCGPLQASPTQGLGGEFSGRLRNPARDPARGRRSTQSLEVPPMHRCKGRRATKRYLG